MVFPSPSLFAVAGTEDRFQPYQPARQSSQRDGLYSLGRRYGCAGRYDRRRRETDTVYDGWSYPEVMEEINAILRIFEHPAQQVGAA